MKETQTITAKGQVTVPAKARKRHALLPHCQVEWVDTEDGLLLRKASKSTRGDTIVASLREGGRWPGRSDDLLSKTRGKR